MLANEPIVVLAVVFVAIVLALCLFKLTIRLVIGSALGLLILVCIGLLVESPWFDGLTQGVFKQGMIIPHIRQMVPIEHISNQIPVRSFAKKEIAVHKKQDYLSIQKMLLQPVPDGSRVIQVENPKGIKKLVIDDSNIPYSSTVSGVTYSTGHF